MASGKRNRSFSLDCGLYSVLLFTMYVYWSNFSNNPFDKIVDPLTKDGEQNPSGNSPKPLQQPLQSYPIAYECDHLRIVNGEALLSRVNSTETNAMNINVYVRKVIPNIYEYRRRFINMDYVRIVYPECEGYYNDSLESVTVYENVLSHPRHTSVSDDDVTLITQLMPNRIGNLVGILNSWPGPISATIYLHYMCVETFIESLQTLNIFGRNNLFIHVAAAKEIHEQHNFRYQINMLRNIALNNSITPYVYYIDTDFIPVNNSYDTIRKYVQELMSSDRIVLVTPALEILSGDSEVPVTKAKAVEMMDEDAITGFHVNSFPRGHSPTNFTRWKDARSPYTVEYEEGFEPYFIMKRTEMPQYPEEYVGYFRNKIAHCFILSQLGYSFLVLPDVFLLHLPHPKSYNSNNTLAKTSKNCAILVDDHFKKDDNWIPQSLLRNLQ